MAWNKWTKRVWYSLFELHQATGRHSPYSSTTNTVTNVKLYVPGPVSLPARIQTCLSQFLPSILWGCGRYLLLVEHLLSALDTLSRPDQHALRTVAVMVEVGLKIIGKDKTTIILKPDLWSSWYFHITLVFNFVHWLWICWADLQWDGALNWHLTYSNLWVHWLYLLGQFALGRFIVGPLIFNLSGQINLQAFDLQWSTDCWTSWADLQWDVNTHFCAECLLFFENLNFFKIYFNVMFSILYAHAPANSVASDLEVLSSSSCRFQVMTHTVGPLALNLLGQFAVGWWHLTYSWSTDFTCWANLQLDDLQLVHWFSICWGQFAGIWLTVGPPTELVGPICSGDVNIILWVPVLF